MKDKYLKQRNALLEEGQALINAGDFKGFNEKKAEIEKLDQDFENAAREQANLDALKDNARVTNIKNKGANVMNGTILDKTNNIQSDDFTNSIEYRKAFMNYVINGTPISDEFKNAAGPTKQSDVGAVIPETVLSKIIDKLEHSGTILPLVTRTSYKSGVAIPTSNVKPVATWTTEGQTSQKQKKGVTQITFGAYKLRCAVSNSLEVDVMALPIFEATIIKNITEAMVKALELGILLGSGSGQPKGILKETAEEGQNIDIADEATVAIEQLEEAEAALPLAYENGAVWLMTKKTFMKYACLKDKTGNYIGRTERGVNGKIERYILDRRVELNDYMETYTDSVEEDTVVAALFKMDDYVLNTNFNMGIKKYEDNETDDIVTKAIIIADGKVVDKHSLVTITKKAAE